MELDKRALDRWLTDDANDFGPADAPDPAPNVPLRPLCNATLDAALRGTTPPFAASDAAQRNELATRRAALVARLMSAPDYAWADIELAVWSFDRDRTNRNCAARLAELLVDLEDGHL